MGATGASSWDEYPIAYPDAPGSAEAKPEVRAACRVAPFDEAAGLVASGKPLEPLAWRFGLLANDFQWRTERWHGSPPVPERPAAKIAGFAGLALLLGGLGMATVSIPAALLLGMGACFCFGVWAAMGKRPPPSGAVLCPTCGYELGGLPPAIPLHLVKGLNFGPIACPECGARWPLVPPGGAADPFVSPAGPASDPDLD